MDPSAFSSESLRRLADEARSVAGLDLLQVREGEDAGVRVVHIELKARRGAFSHLAAHMERFCRRQHLPPRYRIGRDAPLPRDLARRILRRVQRRAGIPDAWPIDPAG